MKLLGRPVQEQVEELAEEYASEAVIMATELNKNHRGRLCLLAGGEPTVVVRGPGQGGRSMELALRFSIAVSKYTKQLQNYDVVLLATGTDGQVRSYHLSRFYNTIFILYYTSTTMIIL